MHIAQKARVATIAVLATILLAGCSAAEPSAKGDSQASPGASATAEQPQTQPEQRQVKLVEVIDPTTLLVTPYRDTDSLYGTDFVVHHLNIISPAKGECGYEDAIAFAKDTLTDPVLYLQYDNVTDDVWINAKGEHYGTLGSRKSQYDENAVKAGFAYPAAELKYPGYMPEYLDEAKSNATGLWGSCSDFGA